MASLTATLLTTEWRLASQLAQTEATAIFSAFPVGAGEPNPAKRLADSETKRGAAPTLIDMEGMLGSLRFLNAQRLRIDALLGRLDTV